MDQAQAYKQYLYGLYKYELHNFIVVNDTLKKVDEVKEEYSQLKAKLKKMKDKLYDDKNYSKWGLTTVQTEKLAKDKNAFDKN